MDGSQILLCGGKLILFVIFDLSFNWNLMDIDEIIAYCLSKKGAEESFPFDETTLVIKVGGKIFILISLEVNFWLNLKCDPERAIELRESYPAISPGYHMSKKHWNTIIPDGSLSGKLLFEMIDHSYELVFQSLPARVKSAIETEKPNKPKQ